MLERYCSRYAQFAVGMGRLPLPDVHGAHIVGGVVAGNVPAYTAQYFHWYFHWWYWNRTNASAEQGERCHLMRWPLWLVRWGYMEQMSRRARSYGSLRLYRAHNRSALSGLEQNRPEAHICSAASATMMQMLRDAMLIQMFAHSYCRSQSEA